MDAVSYSHADKQKQRIEKIIAQPDSASGLVSLPSTIVSGETITIPAGRTVVHPNLQVDGTLAVDGTLFIPSGGTYAATEVDATVVKQNGNVVANDSAVIHNTGAETKAGVLTLTDGLKLQGQNVSPFSGFKNYIINGNFDVWQRGTVFHTTGYTADRWKIYSTGTAPTTTKEVGYKLGTYSITVSGIAGNTDCSIDYYIESNNSKAFAASDSTLSFWFYTDVQRDIKLTILYATEVDVFTSITATNGTTITCPPGWSKHIESIPLNTNFTKGMKITFGGYGLPLTSGNIGLSQVQLEEGSVATPFENLSYALQYQQCRHYYRRYATQQNVSNLAYEMRVAPTESGTAPYIYSSEL